ncbi:hypothetical protein FACS189449_08340 [Alphaproteobacteria bacterium]|nr:hypothetical protein FACS189449_08340 [Alphaproteobacteria bacterium]
MKNLAYICFLLCFFNAYSNDDSKKGEFSPETMKNDIGKGKDTSFDPEVYADISDTAIQNAVSFDGARGLIGFGMAKRSCGASLKGEKNFTSNSITAFYLTIGLDYAKSFRKGLLLSVCALCDISKKSKKKSDWRGMNASYDDKYHDLSGSKSGFLETGMFTPSLSLKCGYHMKEYKLVAFLKLGISRLSLTYNYILNENEHSRVKINPMVPTIGLGAEMKINKKWGCLGELNFPIKRTTKVERNGVEHCVKTGAIDLRLLLSLAFQDPQ